MPGSFASLTVQDLMRMQSDRRPVMTVREAVRGDRSPDGPLLLSLLGRRSLPDGQEAQLLRAAWADSQERTGANRGLGMAAVLAVVVGIGLLVGLYVWDASQSISSFSSPPRPWWLYSLLAGAALASFWAYYRSTTLERAMQQLDDRLALERIQGAEAKAAADEETLSLPALWALTQQRIDHYHRLATGQSSTSFRTGQIIMIVGFVAVIALGALAAFASSGTAAIAASVVAVAGAALSGFVGATFMKSQSEVVGTRRATAVVSVLTSSVVSSTTPEAKNERAPGVRRGDPR